MHGAYAEAMAELENILLFYFEQGCARYMVGENAGLFTPQLLKSLGSSGIQVKLDKERASLWLSGPARPLGVGRRRVENMLLAAEPAADAAAPAPAEEDPWAAPAEPAAPSRAGRLHSTGTGGRYIVTL